jgi:hypothetical protein
MKNGDLIKWKLDFQRRLGVLLGVAPRMQCEEAYFPCFYVLFDGKILCCLDSDVQGVSGSELFDIL